MVKDWMSSAPITIDVKASLSEALATMEKHYISLLPVLENDKLSGIITDMDMKPFKTLCCSNSAAGGFAVILDRVRVEDVMSRTPVTIPSDYTMEEVADVLLKNEAYGVLVVDGNNQLVGVVTQRDINRVFISLTGLRKGGIAFGFLLEDSPGSIKDVTDILRSHGGRIQSILTSYERTVKGYRNVQIRVRKLDRSSLPRILQELREKGRLLYKIDHRENTREVYGTGDN